MYTVQYVYLCVYESKVPGLGLEWSPRDVEKLLGHLQCWELGKVMLLKSKNKVEKELTFIGPEVVTMFESRSSVI